MNHLGQHLAMQMGPPLQFLLGEILLTVPDQLTQEDALKRCALEHLQTVYLADPPATTSAISASVCCLRVVTTVIALCRDSQDESVVTGHTISCVDMAGLLFLLAA